MDNEDIGVDVILTKNTTLAIPGAVRWAYRFQRQGKQKMDSLRLFGSQGRDEERHFALYCIVVVSGPLYTRSRTPCCVLSSSTEFVVSLTRYFQQHNAEQIRKTVIVSINCIFK